MSDSVENVQSPTVLKKSLRRQVGCQGTRAADVLPGGECADQIHRTLCRKEGEFCVLAEAAVLLLDLVLFCSPQKLEPNLLWK